MNARQTIELVVEAKAPTPNWATSKGIYADLTDYPDSVNYYVKCPLCGHVHGSFKTMREAHSKRHCDYCSVELIGKIKKQVAQVVNEPWKKVKPLGKLVGEGIEGFELPQFNNPDDPEPQPPAEEKPGEPAEPDFDPSAEIDRLLFNNWVMRACWDLSKEEGVELSDVVIDDKYDRGGYDPDPDYAENTRYFKAEIGNIEFLVFRDSDEAEAYAKEIVREDLQDNPELFQRDWLIQFIDDDKLAEALGDPNEDYGDDVRDLDYEERLERMVEEDKIEYDDPVFFKKNGEPRAQNVNREKQLDALVEEWAEETKPEFDPWEYLESVYGEEHATKHAIELAGFDEDAAAEAAIREDGWATFVNHQDGMSTELENGVVAARV